MSNLDVKVMLPNIVLSLAFRQFVSQTGLGAVLTLLNVALNTLNQVLFQCISINKLPPSIESEKLLKR